MADKAFSVSSHTSRHTADEIFTGSSFPPIRDTCVLLTISPLFQSFWLLRLHNLSIRPSCGPW